MPLQVPTAKFLTPAGSVATSEEDTSEFLDTEEIYAPSKDATLSEEIGDGQRLSVKGVQKKTTKEKKLAAEDLEELERKVSGVSLSEHERAELKESREAPKRESALQDALDKVDQDKEEMFSEEEDWRDEFQEEEEQEEEEEDEEELVEKQEDIKQPDKKKRVSMREGSLLSPFGTLFEYI